MGTESKGLLAGVDVTTIQSRASGPAYSALLAKFTRRLRQVVVRCKRSQASSGPYYGYGALGWHSNTPMAVDAAVVHRLTGDAEALAHVEWCLRLMSDIGRDLAKHKERVSGGIWPIHSHLETALAADICRASLPSEVIDGIKAVMRDAAIAYHDGSRPVRYFSAGQNIPAVKTLNAGVCALVWGEEVNHPTWRETVELARDAAIGYLRRGTDAAGYGYEGPGYSLCTYFYVYLVAQLLRQRGIEDLFATEPALSNIPLATHSLLFPDHGSLGNYNDLGLLYPHGMPWLPLTARYYHRGDDLALWHAFQGPDHPLRPFGDTMDWYESIAGGDALQAMHVFPYALSLLWWDADEKHEPIEHSARPTADCSRGVECANFRTSWSRDAVYMNVQGAGRTHAAGGHAHADCGHFSIFAHGQYLAIDTGRYNSDEDQHSVILVDGKCHMPTGDGRWGANPRSGRLLDFRRHAMVDYVRADAAHMKDCMWADRHFLFVRSPGELGNAAGGDDAYVVVIDNINVDNATHSFVWQLQTDTSNTVRITGDRTASVVGEKARLDVTFAIPSAEDFPKSPHTISLRSDEKEWAWPYGRNGIEDHPNTGLMTTSFKRPRLLAELWGVNGVMAAVLSPRRAGSPALAVRQVAEQRVLRVEVSWGEYTDTIFAAMDSGYINLADARAWTELALVRRDRAGKIVGTWTVDGEKLTLSGSTI